MVIGKYFKVADSKFKKHYFSGLGFNSSACKKDYIFFAINGEKINGNNFIGEAIKNGARTIVSNQNFHGIKDNILYIKSKNVRKLLSEIAYKIYKKKPKNLIAVTGTNGKSSIANFYYQILKLNKKKVASIGTLGVQTELYKKKVFNTTLDPVSLSVYLEKLKKEKINNVILEASSHGLKQSRLDGLTFKTGIFTNLSHDHLDYHKTFNDYLNSKLYLFKKLLKKNSMIITDNKISEYNRIKNIAVKKKIKIKTISNDKNGLDLISHQYLQDEQSVEIKYNKKIYKFQINLIGKVQIKNILMAMLAAENSGIEFKNIIKIINKIKAVNGRFEKVGVLKNNAKVILDYAHTPDALKTCLQNIKEQFNGKKISIVFGCGGNRDQSKRSKMGKIANYYCDRIYLTDDNPRNENPKKIRSAIKSKINKSKILEISDRSKAIKKAIFDLKIGEILIVAGKGHENIQNYGNKKKIFSDKKEILNCIKTKNKKLFNNLKLNILKEISNTNELSPKIKINKASINSKEVKKNDIFFAIKGKNNDGNLFVKDAFKKGASLVVGNNFKGGTNKIKVTNTLNFLTKASLLLRKNVSSKIIGITGSCGKTSLKELVGKTLEKFSNVTYSQKSFNNKFGVPLSVFNIKKNDDFGIFEIGMDKKGEIDFLSKIVKPDIAVITNISYAHAKNFSNIKQIALAKSEIIKNISKNGSIILNADDQFYNFHRKLALRKKIKVYSFSMNKKSSNINLDFIKKQNQKYKVSINVNNEKVFFYSNSNFEKDIKNLLAAVSIISIFKNIKNLSKNIFYNRSTPTGRGDIKKIKVFKKSFYLVDESYNSNPLSLKSALKNFNMIEVNKSKKHLILGDMLELGKHSNKLHLAISKNINNTFLKNVNVFGKHMELTYKKLNKNKKGLVLKNKSQIIDLIKSDINNNDYLMIKGSNSTGLNKITHDIKTGKINAL